MKRKLNHDNDGISAIGTVLLIIMILVGWQVLAPYLDIPVPLDAFGITEPEPEQITFTAQLYNHYLDEVRASSQTLIDFDPDPRDEHETLPFYNVNATGDESINNHAVRILTNAPKSILSPYTVRVYATMVFWDHSSSQHIVFDERITSGASGEKQFAWAMDDSYVVVTGALYEYTVVKVVLLDPSNNVLFSETFSVS